MLYPHICAISVNCRECAPNERLTMTSNPFTDNELSQLAKYVFALLVLNDGEIKPDCVDFYKGLAELEIKGYFDNAPEDYHGHK